MRFENQTAVVAACGSDAGAACALNYLQQGAKVALYYDEEARLWPFDQISEEERSRLLPIQISGAVIVEQLDGHSFHHPGQDGNGQHLPLLGAAVKVQLESLEQTHQTIQAILNYGTVLKECFTVYLTPEIFPTYFKKALQSSHRF